MRLGRLFAAHSRAPCGVEIRRTAPQGLPTGSVMRFIAEACLVSSQRMSRVCDIASTMVEEMPIFVT